MDFDLVLVGGGLANALIALAVLRRHPDARLALLESSDKIGGNHLWSFHGEMPDEAARELLSELVVARWPGYDVAFTNIRQTFDTVYASVSSERLSEVVSARFLRAPHARLLLGSRVSALAADSVTLVDGQRLTGRFVIDARGPERLPPGNAGYQKFLGLELSLRSPSSLSRPLIMDATVPQTDGLRFFYTLPLSAQRVLVEDTYFSDTPELDSARTRAGVLAYARSLGLDVLECVREEQGCLPLPLALDFAPRPESPLRAGYAGGFFHPTTGYSLLLSLRLALCVAEHFVDLTSSLALRDLCARHARQLRFALLLNRLLFRATPPQHRRDVMERFHRLPSATIERFYALETSTLDRARILFGRPPRGVSVRAALAEVLSA